MKGIMFNENYGLESAVLRGVKLNLHYYPLSGELWISDVSVNLFHRRKGYGTKIMKYVLSKMEPTNKVHIAVNGEQWIENWYAKLGFVKYGENDGYRLMIKTFE